MPWVSGNYAGSQEYKEYSGLKVGDLKQRLVRRGLPHSGRKAILVSRLTENDEAHPFPFMKLPPEIRNKIYRLTATTHHFGRLGRYCKTMYRPHVLIHSLDQDTIVQPGIVCCSKQTRSEGLLIFFQDHRFLFKLPHWDYEAGHRSVEDILPWLDRISTEERKNIRKITFVCNISPHDVPAMDRIHAKLFDEATVIYRLPKFSDRYRWVTSMLQVVHTLQARDPAKFPIYETKKVAIPLQNSSDRSSRDVDLLKFLPGLSWFGEKHEASVQAKTEEEEAETQVVG